MPQLLLWFLGTVISAGIASEITKSNNQTQQNISNNPRVKSQTWETYNADGSYSRNHVEYYEPQNNTVYLEGVLLYNGAMHSVRIPANVYLLMHNVNTGKNDGTLYLSACNQCITLDVNAINTIFINGCVTATIPYAQISA